MTIDIHKLNKIFDNRIRLGIMSALLVNERVSFKFLKEFLEVTDGNLASHLKPLEKSKYLTVEKGFIGRKTNTTYRITLTGENAFKEHISVLEKMIRELDT